MTDDKHPGPEGGDHGRRGENGDRGFDDERGGNDERAAPLTLAPTAAPSAPVPTPGASS